MDFLFSIQSQTVHKITDRELGTLRNNIFDLFALHIMSISDQIEQILLLYVQHFAFIFSLSLLKQANPPIFDQKLNKLPLFLIEQEAFLIFQLSHFE